MIVRLHGVDINVETGGPSPDPSTPALVLIHGFGAALSTWDPIAPSLAETHAVVRADLKGFGRSGHPRDGRYSMDDNARLVIALLDHLRLQRVVLIGHSYGGAVAITVAVELGESGAVRVDGLVLIDAASYDQPLPFFVDVYRRRFSRFMSRFVPITLGSRVVLRSLFANPSLVNAAMVERYARPRRIPGANYSEAQTALQILPESFEAVTAAIRSIAVPTQIIWGDQDNAVPPQFAQRLHRDIRGSQLAILKDVGHMPHEERPAEVLRIIEHFLKGLRHAPLD